jgi:hypothetical protein
MVHLDDTRQSSNQSTCMEEGPLEWEESSTCRYLAYRHIVDPGPQGHKFASTYVSEKSGKIQIAENGWVGNSGNNVDPESMVKCRACVRTTL